MVRDEVLRLDPRELWRVVEQFEVDERRAARDYLELMATLESIDAVRRV